MSRYLDILRESYAKNDSVLCFGMDPVIEKMRIDSSKNLADEIVSFFLRILGEIGHRVSAVKPNVAYYYQYGPDGLRALIGLVERVKTLGIPVIVDAKNADIGRTSAAYAKCVFEVMRGDAVTLNPYMGHDSLEPFFAFRDRGSYVLALTSNEGAKDFQRMRMSSGKPLFEHTLDTICDWNENHGGIGAVIGATQEEFASCVRKLAGMGCRLPLLVPGVGAQGGSYRTVVDALDLYGYEKHFVRINASSSISYAHERAPSLTVEAAAAQAVENLMTT